jgi:hypothetical protein
VGKISFQILKVGAIGITLLSGTFAFAAPNTQTYSYTNKVSTTTASRPICIPQKTLVAPNEKVVFTPVSPTSSPAQRFEWRGESATTSVGKVALAFIYPGSYKITLRAIGFDGTYIEAPCPTIDVRFDALRTSTTTLPAAYIFPFATSTTRALIPKEFTPISGDCFNLGQDISVGYSDDVTVASQGVIYKLQTFLSREGYLKSQPTGYFGSLTLAAVKSFQRKYGLPPTGFVGPMTRSVIKSQTCLG